jgi:hypothetical protein
VTTGYRRWISFAGMMSAAMLCFAVGTTFAQIEWRLSAILSSKSSIRNDLYLRQCHLSLWIFVLG